MQMMNNPRIRPGIGGGGRDFNWSMHKSDQSCHIITPCRSSTPYVEQKSSGMTTKVKKKMRNYQQQLSVGGI